MMQPAAMRSGGTAPAPLLAGMKVLAFVHYLQGPACAQYLADLGADVIKIEPTGGAFERKALFAGLLPKGRSSLFIAANRNQRSLAVDLKSAEGRDIVLRLLDSYDVIIENYRPGVMAKLGLGYEQLRARRPGLIYASASGFGPLGPMAAEPNQDLLAQATSGLIAASGAGVHAVGAAVTEQHGAALLAMGIVAAYARRLVGGEGALVQGNLFSAAIDLQMEAITAFLNQEALPPDQLLARDARLANWYHPAPYGVYRLADAVIAVSLTTADKLVAALADPKLDPIRHLDPFTQRDEYVQRLGDTLAALGYEEVAARFKAHDIWFARMATYADLVSHPQAQHNDTFTEVGLDGDRVRVVNHPLRYDGAVPQPRRAPPGLGEHTRTILQDLGLDAPEIERLAASGVVKLGAAQASTSLSISPSRAMSRAPAFS